MHNILHTNTTLRRSIRVGAVVVFFVAALVLVRSIGGTAVISTASSLGDRNVSHTMLTMDRSVPILISIPALNLKAAFEAPLDLKPDGTLAVPEAYEKVAWYRQSPTPGELGPSVVLGHVDSKTGPAVFFSLGQLVPGDLIEITRADGSVASFKVTALERYMQTEFPFGLVYGDIQHAGLRLVTCSGIYDRTKKHYTHNLVVYAALTELDG